MLEVLVVTQFLGLAIGMPVLVHFLKHRIEVAAREASDRTLADYRKVHAKELEEFGLYARARYRVYPRLYRQLRIAADILSSFVGFSVRPAFEEFTPQRAAEYFEEHEVPMSAQAEIHQALAAGDPQLAAKRLEDLHERVTHAKAKRAFSRAKSLEALELLYLSDGVQAQLENVRSTMARMLVAVDPAHESRSTDAHERDAAMRTNLEQLYHIMRGELRRV